MDLYFPVPLLVEDVEPTVRAAIQAKVSAYLESERAKRDIEPSPEDSVATTYYQHHKQILVDAELEELESVTLSQAARFLEALGLPRRRLEIERSWINVFKPGAQEAQHSHDGSLLSCSYYVAAPQNCGCFVIPDPIGARRSYREFTKTAGSDVLTRREIAVEPQPGRLVMFESWVPHYVQCNKSDQVRVSIAMNLREAPLQIAMPRAAAPPREASLAAAGGAAHTVAGPRSADAKPFLFNELFNVNADLKLALTPINNEIPTVVIDDFLKHAEEARDLVGRTPAANWKHQPGGRNFVDYFDCRLRFPIRYPNNMVSAAQQVVRQVYRVNTRPLDASVDVNWFMQIHAKRGDSAIPHNDITEKVNRSFTCLVYLNRREECSGGTAFFRFKSSGSLVLDEPYLRATRADTKLAETGLDYWLGDAAEAWERVGAVDMAPGRLLIFPSEYFHAAYHPQDSFYDFPRLTIAFWLVS